MSKINDAKSIVKFLKEKCDFSFSAPEVEEKFAKDFTKLSKSSLRIMLDRLATYQKKKEES